MNQSEQSGAPAARSVGAAGSGAVATQRMHRLLPLFIVLGYWVLYAALREALPQQVAALERAVPHHFDVVVFGALALALGRRLAARWRAHRSRG